MSGTFALGNFRERIGLGAAGRGLVGDFDGYLRPS